MPTEKESVLGILMRNRVSRTRLDVQEVSDADRIRWKVKDPDHHDDAEVVADRQVLESLGLDEIEFAFEDQDPVRMALKHRDYILREGSGDASVSLQEDGSWKKD